MGRPPAPCLSALPVVPFEFHPERLCRIERQVEVSLPESGQPFCE